MPAIYFPKLFYTVSQIFYPIRKAPFICNPQTLPPNPISISFHNQFTSQIPLIFFSRIIPYLSNSSPENFQYLYKI